MKVIIPVAGMGTRLKPHTHTIPKVLISIAGKPILSYIIDEIKHFDNVEFIFILGYLGEKIEEFLRNDYKDIKYSCIYQNERKGLGHAVYMAHELIKDDDKVLIVLGDTIFKTKYEFLNEKDAILAVKEVENPQRFGVAIVENGYIKKLVEKPKEPISNLALVGIYYIQEWKKLREALEYIIKNDIKTKNEYQLTDALQVMIERGEKFKPFPIEGWYDCGKPETLLETTKILLETRKKIQNNKDSIIIQPCYIPDSAIIESSVIGPYVSIGENVVIKNSIIKESLIDNGAELINVNLENSLIGSNAYIKGKPNNLNIGDSSVVVL